MVGVNLVVPVRDDEEGSETCDAAARLSHLDTVRGLLTLQDPKQFLFFTRTPNGRRAGKEFLDQWR